MWPWPFIFYYDPTFFCMFDTPCTCIPYKRKINLIHFLKKKTHTFSSHEIYIDKDDVSVTASKNPFNNVKNGRSCLPASPLQMYNTKCHLKTEMKYWTLQNHFCNINMGGSCINYQWKTLSTLHKMTSTGDLYEDKTTPNHSKNIFTVAHHVDPIKNHFFFFLLRKHQGVIRALLSLWSSAILVGI